MDEVTSQVSVRRFFDDIEIISCGMSPNTWSDVKDIIQALISSSSRNLM